MIQDENILQKTRGIREEIVDLRRDFHQHPEIALQEFNTARKVERILRGLGIETKMMVKDTGVRGTLKGSLPGKTIALRADLDALPVQEETDLPFSSKNAGAMHACGHDAHTAMLLGAAMVLAEREQLTGNVVFIFQPAEETGAGAKPMIEEGVLEGVDSIFGLHVYVPMGFGTLGYKTGPFMAAGDFFDVKIMGKGGHGGWPHLAIDPIAIAANAISSLQTIVSREVDPLESAVVSICKMEAGGGSYNIIPDSATFGGTIRSHGPELREYLPRRLKEILEGVTSGMRGSYEFSLTRKFPAVINEEKMTQLVVKVAQDLLGKDKVSQMKPLMGSEDFSYYLHEIPGTFVFLGAESEEKGIIYPLHHPRYDIDEDILPIGAALHAAVALEYLARK